MGLLRRGPHLPAGLASRLAPGEQISSPTETSDGQVLAVSRFGLWVADGDDARRIDWHLISRARLTDGRLDLTVADPVGEFDHGTVLLRDQPEVTLRPVRLTKLTDSVHHRVRRSVAVSDYLPWPGAGGWVVLRRVAGRDGLTPQVRLDADGDPNAAGFAAAVAAAIEMLWPPEVPR